MRNARAGAILLCCLILILPACSATATDDQSTSNASNPSSSSPEAPSDPTPTMLLLDASGSMRTPDLSGTRIAAARSAITSFVGSLAPTTSVGLVRIGGTRSDGAANACDDTAVVAEPKPGNAQAMDAATAGVAPTGRTPTGTAMRNGARALPQSGASAMIIVSDGEANCAPYPCDVAQELHRTHPALMISAIALHASATAFRCLTEPSAGIAVGADSAQELARRLAALGDVNRSRTRLAPNGISGVYLGESLTAVRERHPDVPDGAISRRPGDVTAISWRDCVLVFDDSGTLVQIRLRSGATIDGLSIGDGLEAARSVYGQPLSSEVTSASEARVGDRVETFVADASSGNRWRIILGHDRIQQIALCRCGPGAFPRLLPEFPELSSLQALPEAGGDGLFGRWWIRGATLVADRDARRVYIWASDGTQQYPTEAVARIDRIDGAGGSATVTASTADSGSYAAGTAFAFSAHPLPQGGVVLTVHFAQQQSRDWCGATVISECFE